jgi:hypothetical protein
LDTSNLDYLYTLANLYLKRGKLQKAKTIAEQMVAKHPEQRIGPKLLKIIDRNLPNVR